MAVLAGLLVLALVSAIFTTAKPRDAVSWVEAALRDGLAPLLYAVNRAGRAITGLWTAASGVWDAHRENERLRAELAALREENYLLQEFRRENEVLRAALQLPPWAPPAVIHAEVVARPLNNWWGVLTVNKGSVDGVAPQMGVVAPGGAVGHVRAVTRRTAEIVLLIDPRSAVGGIVQRTGEPVLVEGLGYPGTHLRLRPLVAAPDIQVGDVVVTSGMSQLFRKGIPIGQVDEVDEGPYGLSVDATLRPFVDFAKLEVVSIVARYAELPEADGR